MGFNVPVALVPEPEPVTLAVPEPDAVLDASPVWLASPDDEAGGRALVGSDCGAVPARVLPLVPMMLLLVLPLDDNTH